MRRILAALASAWPALAGRPAATTPTSRRPATRIENAAVKSGEAVDDIVAEGADATGKAMEEGGHNLQEASGQPDAAEPTP